MAASCHSANRIPSYRMHKALVNQDIAVGAEPRLSILGRASVGTLNRVFNATPDFAAFAPGPNQVKPQFLGNLASSF